jgi:hypothetical protein
MLLLLEEIDLNDITEDGPPAALPVPLALVAALTPSQQRPTAPAPTSSSASSGPRNSHYRGCDGKSSGGSGGPRPGGAPFRPGTGHANPWSGTVQLWPHD